MKSLNSNNLGKTFLVEDCQKIGIKPFIKRYKSGLRDAMLTSDIEVVGERIGLTTSKVGNNGYRYFFLCPICNRRVGVLFKHPLSELVGCRLCLGLEYRKRRYKGMIESNI
jgi:hypothetical protein